MKQRLSITLFCLALAACGSSGGSSSSAFGTGSGGDPTMIAFITNQLALIFNNNTLSLNDVGPGNRFFQDTTNVAAGESFVVCQDLSSNFLDVFYYYEDPQYQIRIGSYKVTMLSSDTFNAELIVETGVATARLFYDEPADDALIYGCNGMDDASQLPLASGQARVFVQGRVINNGAGLAVNFDAGAVTGASIASEAVDAFTTDSVQEAFEIQDILFGELSSVYRDAMQDMVACELGVGSCV